MKAVPQISHYMTTHPHSVGVDQSISKADKMMKEFKIRHLPVMENAKLIGIISDRDIKSVMAFKDINPEVTTVSEIVIEDPYIVKPSSLLSDVCAEMCLHKYGSALVVDNNKLVGIFTWVDALGAVSELFEGRLKK
jgi:acetoin utilization protein AcuB